MISLTDRQNGMILLDEARKDGASLTKACDCLGISIRSCQRWNKNGVLSQDQRSIIKRNKPANALSPQEKAEIIAVCNTEVYRSLPPSQIVPMLADAGVYIASESSFYRVLRAAKQLVNRGKASPVVKRYKPDEHKATAANQVWSWDITFLPTLILGQFFRLYLMMDVFSRKVVGWEVHEKESAELASQLVTKACLSEGVILDGIILHSDNGSPMKGATMLATLQRLGVIPSFSRPSVSDDNPYSESLFKTIKYTPSYPGKPFADIAQAREWVMGFVYWYNNTHCHSGIRFVTPSLRHQGKDGEILAKRHKLYQEAKSRRPDRWAGNTRNWTRINSVYLNPNKKHSEKEKTKRIYA